MAVAEQILSTPVINSTGPRSPLLPNKLIAENNNVSRSFYLSGSRQPITTSDYLTFQITSSGDSSISINNYHCLNITNGSKQQTIYFDDSGREVTDLLLLYKLDAMLKGDLEDWQLPAAVVVRNQNGQLNRYLVETPYGRIDITAKSNEAPESQALKQLEKVSNLNKGFIAALARRIHSVVLNSKGKVTFSQQDVSKIINTQIDQELSVIVNKEGQLTCSPIMKALESIKEDSDMRTISRFRSIIRQYYLLGCPETFSVGELSVAIKTENGEISELIIENTTKNVGLALTKDLNLSRTHLMARSLNKTPITTDSITELVYDIDLASSALNTNS